MSRQLRSRADRTAAGAIVLIGFMGSGKSTAARALADSRGTRALDSDTQLERELGHSIAQHFERDGEASFRAAEERLVLQLLHRARREDVISLGGGSVLSTRVQAALAHHIVVLIDVDSHQAWERVSRGGQRPLARERDAFLALHAQRAELYERLADVILPGARRDCVLRAAGAIELLRHAPDGTRLVWASAASGEYPVLFGRGLIVSDACATREREGDRRGGGGERAAARKAAPAANRDGAPGPRWWPLPRQCSRAFCVSDEHVAPLYLRGVQPVQQTIVLPAGESAKTLAGARRVWEGLLRAGMTRGDHVVALGGGVVGDLAGFCAATYQRGVPVVHVPSTLVAQVDSAYGGKTGVDLAQGKNYVGAYHQPAGVLVDPATLATLPPRELAAGWVEVAKTALLAGGPLWTQVRDAQPGSVPDQTILACARHKLDVVARDERDDGARQALNLGHTVGHAIETATRYQRFLHGEAVGLGLLAALRLSGAQDLRTQVRQLLQARGLPTRLAGVEVQEVLDATRRDKKRLGARPVPFVLLSAPGAVQIGADVGERELRAAVEELCEA
ncbi:MAG: shikimate kinase [Solirubrobacteraceae bacterium]